MSLGPIPFTAIVEYATIFDVGDFEDFLYLMRLMDETLMSLDNARADRKQSGSDNGSKKNSSKGRR